MTRVKLDKYFSAYNDGNFGGSDGLCFVINNISENSLSLGRSMNIIVSYRINIKDLCRSPLRKIFRTSRKYYSCYTYLHLRL